MSITGLISYSMALAVAAVIPGPQIFAIVAQAVQKGRKQAAWMTLGMALGDLAYLSMVLAGLAVLAETLSWVLIVIKWVGIAYLAWMAIQFWRSPTQVAQGDSAHETPRKRVFISGFLITMGNPKSVLFYISLMPTIIDMKSIGILDALILLGATAVILTVLQFGFVLAAAQSRTFFGTSKNIRMLNRGAAVCMGGAAVTIALRD